MCCCDHSAINGAHASGGLNETNDSQYRAYLGSGQKGPKSVVGPTAGRANARDRKSGLLRVCSEAAAAIIMAMQEDRLGESMERQTYT